MAGVPQEYYVNDCSQIHLGLSTITITLHPLSPLQSSQSPLKDRARQSMSATLKYACWRGGCVVMTCQAVSITGKGRGDWVGYSQRRPNVTHWRALPGQLCKLAGTYCGLRLFDLGQVDE